MSGPAQGTSFLLINQWTRLLIDGRIGLFDITEQVSKSSSLEGQEISFKATATPPFSVTLRHWDVRDHVPGDPRSKFDIVHLHFSSVLMNEEVPSIQEKLYKRLTL